MVVIVKVQDNTGKEIGSFQAEDEKSFCELAAMHGIEILQSCGAGFCGVCLCDIVEGKDGVEANKLGNSGINLEKDEKGDVAQVLGCIGGVKKEMFSDNREHVIVLKRVY